MQYRNFNKTGEKVSLFGLGTMRMPLDASGDLDKKASIDMIRNSIDNGVNYIDTAYMYHDFKSEDVVGEALQDGYRERVFLADKMPVWLAKDEAHMREIFEEQLVNCKTDCFDFYLIHNITVPVWKRVQKLNCLAFLDEMKAQGKIKHLGFSFHDELDFFKEIIDFRQWDFCQIQLNFMDKNYQAGVSGLKYAASKGVQLIIMEPLKGGKLVDKLPQSVSDFWEETKVWRTPADWALRWVANFPEVLTILNGVHSKAQMLENIDSLEDSLPDSLSAEELGTISNVGDEYNKLIKYSCTDCKYCLPCPKKIPIPVAIQFCNEWSLYGKSPKVKLDYHTWINEGSRGSDCINCGQCEIQCPQHLPIMNIMKEAAETFED